MNDGGYLSGRTFSLVTETEGNYTGCPTWTWTWRSSSPPRTSTGTRPEFDIHELICGLKEKVDFDRVCDTTFDTKVNTRDDYRHWQCCYAHPNICNPRSGPPCPPCPPCEIQQKNCERKAKHYSFSKDCKMVAREVSRLHKVSWMLVLLLYRPVCPDPKLSSRCLAGTKPSGLNLKLLNIITVLSEILYQKIKNNDASYPISRPSTCPRAPAARTRRPRI
jgi:hypothetical protein